MLVTIIMCAYRYCYLFLLEQQENILKAENNCTFSSHFFSQRAHFVCVLAALRFANSRSRNYDQKAIGDRWTFIERLHERKFAGNQRRKGGRANKIVAPLPPFSYVYVRCT